LPTGLAAYSICSFSLDLTSVTCEMPPFMP
jgi:hypothetical protein